MISFSVRSDLESVISQWSRVMSRQVPYAVMNALNNTAIAAKQEVERQLPSLIDRPTPTTIKGFWYTKAEKTNLVAKVEFRPGGGRNSSPRDYLSPIVFSGDRKLKAFERSLQRTGLLPSEYSALPGSAAKIDAYGNMLRAQISEVISYFKANGGSTSSMTDKQRLTMQRINKRTARRGITYFVGRPGGGRLPMGIWEKKSIGMGTEIKPIIIFIRKPTYRQQLEVPGIAKRVINERFSNELRITFAQAKRTAIPKVQMTLI